MHVPRFSRNFLAMLALLLFGIVLAGEAEEQQARDEGTFKAAKLGSASADLLDFFRKRTLDDAQRQRIGDLIKKLGDDDFLTRERTTKELVKVGPAAVPALQQAASNTDAEIAGRAARCLEVLGTAHDTELMAAALRLLLVRKPANAVEVLLAYLPSAHDTQREEDIVACLAQLGVIDGKPAPALVAAAGDAQPLRRLAAAGALARATGDEYRTAARKLLHDADPRVRFHTAQALLAVSDKTAVPALLALLTDAPLTVVWLVEDQLCRIAGEQAPRAAFDPSNAASRRKARDAWEEWWKANGDKIDLAKVTQEERLLGLTLICEFKDGNGGGRVWECGADGKLRWEITGLTDPSDAHVLPGGKVLIAECNGNRVTERDREGKVLWEKRTANTVVSCQRLANGNTFIATYTELSEVTREGKTVYSHLKPGSIHCAVKQKNGHIFYVTSNNKLVEIDEAGKELRNIAAGNTSGWGGIEVLPNGRFLIAQYQGNKVVEIDENGKVFWESTVQQATWATRLSNGNTLVASTEARRVIELDRLGKKVWEQETQGRVFRVRRR